MWYDLPQQKCAKLCHGIGRSEAIFPGVSFSALGMHISIVPNSLQEIRAIIQATTQKPPRNNNSQPKAYPRGSGDALQRKKSIKGPQEITTTVYAHSCPTIREFVPNFAVIFENWVRIVCASSLCQQLRAKCSPPFAISPLQSLHGPNPPPPPPSRSVCKAVVAVPYAIYSQLYGGGGGGRRSSLAQPRGEPMARVRPHPWAALRRVFRAQTLHECHASVPSYHPPQWTTPRRTVLVDKSLAFLGPRPREHFRGARGGSGRGQSAQSPRHPPAPAQQRSFSQRPLSDPGL